MITGELRSKVDAVWNAFWSGGISNPIEVIEQITYLLFIRGLDVAQLREENKASRLGQPIERIIFPPVNDARGRPYADLRWSRFKNRDLKEMFLIPGQTLLIKVVNMLDEMSRDGRNTKRNPCQYTPGGR